MHPRYEQGRMPSNVVGATRTAAEAACCQGRCPPLCFHPTLPGQNSSRSHNSRLGPCSWEAARCQGSCPLLCPHMMLLSHDPSRFHASHQGAMNPPPLPPNPMAIIPAATITPGCYPPGSRLDPCLGLGRCGVAGRRRRACLLPSVSPQPLHPPKHPTVHQCNDSHTHC